MEPICVQRAPDRLDRVVIDCLRESERALAERSIAVTRQIAPDLPDVPMDASLIREAIRILLDDTIRTAVPVNRLRVTVKESRGVHMLALKNSGEGLTDVQREVLFTGEARPGTLARARAIVSAHGGTCWANGKPGRGRTCYVTLTPRGST